MESFIEKNKLFSLSQYGFRKSHSTQHAILDIVNTIQTNMDKRSFSCGVFIDLKKAFDTVDHKILLDKLYYYNGFRDIINQWFSSCLEDRTQTTQIGSLSRRKRILLLVCRKVLSWVHCFFLVILTISKNVLKSFDFFICWWHKYSICG